MFSNTKLKPQNCEGCEKREEHEITATVGFDEVLRMPRRRSHRQAESRKGEGRGGGGPHSEDEYRGAPRNVLCRKPS